jgi:hypothetical protein
MGDPDAPPLQAGELLQLLDRHAVRYVVVGGLAATVHGATRVTFDIDREALASRAHRRTAFGVTILVADLDDIIESKQALGRESDLVALPELHRLRARSG